MRPVNFLQDVASAVVVGANDDAVRNFEVADGGTLAQNLGVEGNAGRLRLAILGKDAGNLVARANRHRGLGDDDHWLREGTGDFRRRNVNET